MSVKEGRKLLSFFRQDRGFTLLELMIVVVIVGILAAVAVPLYKNGVKRAKASEAEATLGTIKNALRIIYADNGEYPDTPADSLVWNITGVSIDSIDFGGKFFLATDYKYAKETASTFDVVARGSVTGVSDVVRSINEEGTISKTAPW